MYLSNRLDDLKHLLADLLPTASEPQKAFYKGLLDVVCEAAGQVDILSEKVRELEEKSENYNIYTEHLGATLQQMQSYIVGDVQVDTDAYTAEYDADEECDCGHEHEHFATVQCPFCSELFLCAESADGVVACPLCNKSVSVEENRVDRA